MTTQDCETYVDVTTADGATKVETFVQCRLAGQVRDLRVVVKDKGLLLRGRACTYHARQLAEQAVTKLTSLPILTNEIEVSSAMGQTTVRATAGRISCGHPYRC
jgi:hypothetical protein